MSTQIPMQAEISIPLTLEEVKELAAHILKTEYGPDERLRAMERLQHYIEEHPGHELFFLTNWIRSSLSIKVQL